jgi:hypothetical protein
MKIILVIAMLSVGCSSNNGRTEAASEAPAAPVIGMSPIVSEVHGTAVDAKLSLAPSQAATQGTQVDATISVQ